MACPRNVILLPSYAHVSAYRMRCADAKGSVAFGTEVSTALAWVSSLWGLFGDGRTIATRAERAVAVELAGMAQDARQRGGIREAEQVGARLEGGDLSLSGHAARPLEHALSAGMVDLIARLLESASGLSEFEAALGEEGRPASLAFEERAVLDVAARARCLLDRGGAIEPGCAMRALPKAIGAARIAKRVVAHARPRASLQLARFLEALANAGAIESFEIIDAPASIEKAAARFADRDAKRRASFGDAACGADLATRRGPGWSVDAHSVEGEPTSAAALRFAFPSGRYAEPLLVADIAREAAERGRVAVCARDPLALYEQIAPALACAGIPVAVRARRRFAETGFGRAWLSLFRCVHDEDATVADLSDVLLSPFSGLSVAQAQDIDAQMRGNRLMTATGCLAQVAAASDDLERLVETVSDIESDIVLGAVEDALWRIPDVSGAYRREQAAAVGMLREAMRAVRAIAGAADGIRELAGIADDQETMMRLCARELGRASVSVAREALPDDGLDDAAGEADGAFARNESVGWRVLFASMEDAAALGDGACSAAVLCDMTNVAYPAASKGDAGAVLLEKIGLSAEDVRPAENAIDRQRAALCALMALPTEKLVIERCLFDAGAEPTYPAAAVQELVDCFRADPTATDDVDNAFSLPPSLRAGMLQRGEELLFENAAVRHGAQRIAAFASPSPFGRVSSANRDRIVLPREGRGGRIVRDPCLSPSQIESYLECPYKWFAQRRLRLEEIDAGFGPVEMGDFAHHALESFYRAFWEQTGRRKVNAGTLGRAREIMRSVLAQPNDHLVAITELERRDLEALKQRMVSFLDFEVQLLPGFSPAYVEFDIPQDAGVRYAGCGVLGRVDRIDADEKGNLIVIDYKSSVSRDYDLHDADADYPRKVQALVYAQAVQRMTGQRVVGAVYVSYGRTPQVAGAFDPDVVAPLQLPSMRHEACRPRAAEGETFSGVLDATEKRVGAALERMLAGDVMPRPLTAGSCAWCPVRACPERKG